MSTAPSIPVVDLGAGETAEVVDLVRTACKDFGFFYIANHGVPDSLVASAFAGSRALFQLPAATKEALPSGAGVGYSSKTIKLDPATQTCPDTREQWKIPRHGYDEDYRDARTNEPEAGVQRGDEYWPPVAGFRDTIAAYFSAMDLLSRRIVRLLALALGLPAGFFERPGMFDRPSALLLFNHYFAERSQPDHGVYGCGAHTDYGMLTVLSCDAVPGLQICLNKAAPPAEQKWIDVGPRPGHFIVNLGDVLEMWSGGKFLSNLHRVVVDGQERFSIPFFFEPNPLCPIDSLPDVASPLPPGSTYIDWLRHKYEETGEVAVSYRAKPNQ